MAWKDIKTGQVTDYYPPSSQSASSNVIHVQDQHVYTPQNHTGMPDTFAMGQALGADPRAGRALLWFVAAVGTCLCLVIIWAAAQVGWAKLMKADAESRRGKPTVWSARGIKWTPAVMFHLGGPSFEVGGPDAFVTGNVDGMNLDAFSNLTIQGDVSNSKLGAYNTLTVGNVSNSTLEAHKIVITGKAVNVKRIILRPYEGIPFSKRPH